MLETHPGYRRDGDVYLIEIRLTDPRQMFNSLDPAPFIEKDLDDDAARYIIDAVKEFHLDTPLKLLIHVPRASPVQVLESIPEAIHNYFAYRAVITRREIRYVLRGGRRALVVGLLMLILCLWLSELIGSLGDGTAVRIFSEGMLIGGWVAMWRPIEVLLYEWWPMRWNRRVFEKIGLMPIDVLTRD